MSHVKVGAVDYTVQLDTVHSGFTDSHCWVHNRAGCIPGVRPEVVMTMQEVRLIGTDIFNSLHEMSTGDRGQSWSAPKEAYGLHSRYEGNNERIVVCDFTPSWHAASKKLLGTGALVGYDRNQNRSRFVQTAYAAYDPLARSWTDWRQLELPPKFVGAVAGCTQRYDLPNGDVLLPVYFHEGGVPYLHVTPTGNTSFYRSTVLRCRFDGKTLSYVEHGTELVLEKDRGYYEPSVTRYGDAFYITLRANDRADAARSADGIHFDVPKTWTWDDGETVPIYNTQQHWVTHSSGLFLVYCRKAENNNHVVRHRAPLFIAEVDPGSLCLIRSSERILVPEHGAGLGNFGVVNVGPDETWVTTSEWMTAGARERGADNRVYVARIKWSKPNRDVESREDC